ncbi:MAG: sodium:solute symporter [Calditrichaeota bacterium]|nr:MAG: sodium:solute symporter [Calditrichota bacterium]
METLLKISTPDMVILLFYLVATAGAGILFRGRQQSSRDYFLGDRSLPWLAVCLSIVATETSTLTFISIPGLAYQSNMNFLQVALGYICGRIIVSFLLLPAYYRRTLNTSYELMRIKYGNRMHTLTSVLFLITRLLADGVRLYATAIPLALMTGWSMGIAIVIIAAATMIYTVLGGIRSVVWMDVLQSGIYMIGALTAAAVILSRISGGADLGFAAAGAAGKFSIFTLGAEGSWRQFFSTSYTLPAGLIGGALLSMASHGTDQIIVQRLLACRSLYAGQKALVTSGFLVLVQFAVFLFLGVLLYLFYQGIDMPSDHVFPRFILEEMPAGLKGIIIAAIFAAAMSTLSSSLNALASSSLFDLIKTRIRLTIRQELLTSRMITLFWGIVLTGSALLLHHQDNPVVELGLSIASYTYGGVLGVFLMSVGKKAPGESNALISLWCALAAMIWFIGGGVEIQIMLGLPLAAIGLWIGWGIKIRRERIFIIAAGAFIFSVILFLPSPRAAWTWYVPAGSLMAVVASHLQTRLNRIPLLA